MCHFVHQLYHCWIELGDGCLQQEEEKEVLMRSCTDLCWKLSGRPPPAMPPPALPPSVVSSDPPQCAGDSSGQHLNIWRQGERMRVDGAQEVYSATPSSCAARTTPHPNTLPPCTTRTSRSHVSRHTSPCRPWPRKRCMRGWQTWSELSMMSWWRMYILGHINCSALYYVNYL